MNGSSLPPCKSHTLPIAEHSSKEGISGPERRNLPQRSCLASLPPACACCPLQQALPGLLAGSHSKAPLFSSLAQG